MDLATYIRPSGNPITVNDTPETRAFAAEHGWVLEKAKSPKAEKPAKKSK